MAATRARQSVTIAAHPSISLPAARGGRQIAWTRAQGISMVKAGRCQCVEPPMRLANVAVYARQSVAIENLVEYRAATDRTIPVIELSVE